MTLPPVPPRGNESRLHIWLGLLREAFNPLLNKIRTVEERLEGIDGSISELETKAEQEIDLVAVMAVDWQAPISQTVSTDTTIVMWSAEIETKPTDLFVPPIGDVSISGGSFTKVYYVRLRLYRDEELVATFVEHKNDDGTVVVTYPNEPPAAVGGGEGKYLYQMVLDVVCDAPRTVTFSGRGPFFMFRVSE